MLVPGVRSGEELGQKIVPTGAGETLLARQGKAPASEGGRYNGENRAEARLYI